MLGTIRHSFHLSKLSLRSPQAARRFLNPCILWSSYEGKRQENNLYPKSQCQGLATVEQEVETSPLQTLERSLSNLSTEQTVTHQAPLVIVISGPSGVGKDAVLNSLRKARRDLSFVVTATSRDKRPGEVHGKDYLFVTKEQFERWIEDDKMLEHAKVYGEYKGIPRMQVDDALSKGSDVVLRIDVQGAQTVRRLMPHSVHIFLVAESESALVERLVARKTEPMDKLLLRVHTARQEFESIRDFDYVVVNEEGQLEHAVQQIGTIIDAEKLRVKRATIPILQQKASQSL